MLGTTSRSFHAAAATHEISVTPPETLVKFDAPLFGGIEPQGKDSSHAKVSHNQENNAKLEDMLNSMLPPRLVLFEYSLIKHLNYLLFANVGNGWKSQAHGFNTPVRNLHRV